MIHNQFSKLKRILAFYIAYIYKTITKQQYLNNLWLISGYGGNEEALFQYICENHPEIEVYLIEKNKAVSFDGSLKKDSFISYIYIQLAQVLICTHSLSHNLGYTSKELNHALKVQVFHGVFGLKRKSLDNQRKMNEYDIVIASSEHEKKIKEKWKIDSNKIYITGLPRHDILLQKHMKFSAYKKNELGILYVPTWRVWLKKGRKQHYLDYIFNRYNASLDEYVNSIQEFLNNERLSAIIKKYNIRFNVFFHPNMKFYLKKLIGTINKLDNINVINEAKNVQDEIVKNNILITDYSSIAWEFLLLRKPVIFFHFDLAKYLSSGEGSYIDLIGKLFGPVGYEPDEVISIIESTLMADYFNEHYETLSDKARSKYIPFEDGNNCKRVVNSILLNLK